MKRIFSFLLSIVFYAASAQAPGKITYYYQGKPLSFTISNNRVVIGLATGENTNTRMGQLATLLQLPATAIKSMSNTRLLSVKFSAANSKSITAQLRRQGFVNFIHPCFTSAYGKDMGYGEELVVKLKSNTSKYVFEQLIKQAKVHIVRQYAFADNIYLLSAGPGNAYNAVAVANRFFETGLFEYAEPDLTLFDGLLSDPADPLFPYQWAHLNTGTPAQYNGAAGIDMKVQQAWGITTGAGIKVAVVDEGVDIMHADLKDNLLQGFDCISGTANPGDGQPLAEGRGHGTSCTGIIAAIANNNTGVAGIAPSSKIIPVNLATANGNFTSYANIAAGFDYAWQHDADIISNSWGGGSPSGIIEDAINRALTLGRGGKGTVILFASGNENSIVFYPAILPGVIAVGGVNMCGQRKSPASCDGETWWGANYGLGLDVVAPCVKIATTDISGTGGYNGNAGSAGDYNLGFNGTSSATPHAAAVVALVLAANNNLTVKQVRSILETTCTKLPSYTYKMTEGQPNGTWNNETGHGMLDAFRAVQAAVSGYYCSVQVKTTGATRFCAGGSVQLAVVSPVAGTSYQWRKDGSNLSSGTEITVTTTGNYDVVAVAASGCAAIAAPVSVIALTNSLPLTANAGPDKFVCLGQSVKLGGNPVATNGAPWLAKKRVFGMDRRGNTFVKFSTGNPLQFDTIQEHVMSDEAYAANNFFTGGDFTPYGYYAITPESNQLFRIDTVTGNQQLIGKAPADSGHYWMGLSWDPSNKILYGIAIAAGGSKLYAIDPFTAATKVVADVAVASVLWLAVSNNGDMYAMSGLDNYVYRINKVTGVATRLPNPVGLNTGFEQDADFDPLTDILYMTAKMSSAQASGELRTVNLTTGISTVVGPLGDGLSQVDATGIAGPEYKYNWSPAAGLNDRSVAVPVAAPLTTTVYQLNVIDMCGNTASSQVTVNVNTTTPTVAITAPADSICVGMSVRLSATKNSAYAYQWYREGNLLPGATDSFYVVLEGGSYTVKIAINNCENESLPFTVKSCEIRMNNNNPVSACSGRLYDSGGSTGNYANNQSFTRTITAATPGSKLQVSFNSFATELNQDKLTIYDGPDTSSPILAVLSGAPVLPLSYFSTAGTLTFHFQSNGSVNMEGWDALLSCYQPKIYRSKNSGNLAEASTWQVKSATGFEDATEPPHVYDDSIILQTDHVITHTGVAELDQVWIQPGGTLRIIQSGYLSLLNGPGNDLQVDGTLEIKDAGSIDGNGIIKLNGNLVNSVHLKNIAVRTEVSGTSVQSITTAGSLTALYVSNPSAVFNIGNDLSIDTLTLDVDNGAMKMSASTASLVTINHQLNLRHGRLVLGANTVLNLAADAVTEGAGASSFVEGPVRCNANKAGVSSMLFPIGKEVYRPVTLGILLSGDGASAYQAEMLTNAPDSRNLPPSISEVSNRRYFKISSMGGQQVSSAIVVLAYGEDDGVTDAASLRIVKDNGADWIDLGGIGSGNSAGTIISGVNFTSFGNFALANAFGGNNILPVKWLAVNAKEINNQVQVTWKISDEINVRDYQVERSPDGTAFTGIATVQPGSNGAAEKQYEATDKRPLKGNNFYRIRQADMDGRYSYSKTVLVQLGDGGSFTLLPNPATDAITIRNSQAIQQLQCFNSSGILVYSAKPSGNLHTIAVSSWVAGIYYIKMISGGKLITTRFIKQ